MHDQKELWREIEQLQEKLHEIVSKKGINSPEAIRVSQEFRNKMKEYHDSKNQYEP
ncbi:spo0e like sporulation regulatory protein [Lucifera butyrica]|uniref:Spo0e like sporulation regulatory protein n=1 Tax=Lucifera butyrica TaxID=1351585 RepID=A0A498R3R3_9FIRM|nr:aspartyl-phosphate phosphatase Spo0E family protein [Lucifera butyrica]VBB07306.1 spo0e like sporulation regulatory protein [Lucifera butyrica]